jgi:hypothetical protein
VLLHAVDDVLVNRCFSTSRFQQCSARASDSVLVNSARHYQIAKRATTTKPCPEPRHTMATTKSKAGAMHSAGIFSDMTVDGPEIGTLVVIVDRAKNLPNRKTIGKQDPYCAARLGKEAKKTETDRRGGQTPRGYASNRGFRCWC